MKKCILFALLALTLLWNAGAAMAHDIGTRGRLDMDLVLHFDRLLDSGYGWTGGCDRHDDYDYGHRRYDHRHYYYVDDGPRGKGKGHYKGRGKGHHKGHGKKDYWR